MNKKIVFLFAAMIGMAGVAFSQQAQTTSNDLTAPQSESAEKRAEKMTNELEAPLNLTGIQKQKLYEVNLGVEWKNDAIRNDASMSKEEKTKRIQSNLDQKRKVYEQILEPEQFKKLPPVPTVAPAPQKAATTAKPSAPAQPAKPSKPMKSNG